MYGAASDSEWMIRPLAIARGSVTVAALTMRPIALGLRVLLVTVRIAVKKSLTCASVRLNFAITPAVPSNSNLFIYI
jgi:hypothetical protein